MENLYGASSVTNQSLDLYVPIKWPEVQSLMGKEGFLDNCHLIDDSSGYKKFGDSAYMVNLRWLNSLT